MTTDNTLSEAQKSEQKHNQTVCPSCGYCPTCGRQAIPYYPVHPGWTLPYYPQTPWITYTTTTTGVK